MMRTRKAKVATGLAVIAAAASIGCSDQRGEDAKIASFTAEEIIALQAEANSTRLPIAIVSEETVQSTGLICGLMDGRTFVIDRARSSKITFQGLADEIPDSISAGEALSMMAEMEEFNELYYACTDQNPE